MTLGGSTEANYDFLTVNGTAYDGSLEGIVVESTDNVITMSIDSDGSVQSGPLSGLFLMNVLQSQHSVI